MSRKILGLDIRCDTITAVLVESTLKGNRIEAYKQVPVSEEEDFETSISQSIKMIAAEIDVADPVCLISFPAEKFSFRNIRVPFKEKKKIRQVLPFELESMLPFPVDDLIIDFQALKLPAYSAHEDKESSTDLIITAVEKSILETYLNILAAFKINPKFVAVGGYQTASCLSGIPGFSKNWILIDLDSKKTTMFAVSSGQIFLVRPLQVNTSDPSCAKSVCDTIQQTLSASEDIIQMDFQPECAFITGNGLNGLELDEEIARILEFPVKRLDLARETDILVEEQQTRPWKSEHMDNAFALALTELQGKKGFNFRKGPMAAKKLWIKHQKDFIKSGILASVVLILAFLSIFAGSYLLNKKAADLDNQINEIFKETFPDEKITKYPFEQMVGLIENAKKRPELSEKTGKNIRTIDILNDISKFVPKDTDVELTRLDIRPENIMITGNTDTFNSVDTMKTQLEKSDIFSKVTINSSSTDKTINRVRFKLKVEL